jgi:hypothetical protein
MVSEKQNVYVVMFPDLLVVGDVTSRKMKHISRREVRTKQNQSYPYKKKKK